MLAGKLFTLVAAVAQWSPLFAHVSFLPALLFPFARLLPTQECAAFELATTFLSNWCRHWFVCASILLSRTLCSLLAAHTNFTINECICTHDRFEFFPHPPLRLLTRIDAVVAAAHPQLHTHLTAIGVTAHSYAWLVMQSLFTEVFTGEQWLRAFDHVFR
jgi:hypothetical protein